MDIGDYKNEEKVGKHVILDNNGNVSVDNY